MCLCLPASPPRSWDSKELISEPSIFPLALVSGHLCVILFREENNTKALSNYCWPFMTPVLLVLEMNILAREFCSDPLLIFLLWGRHHLHGVIYEAQSSRTRLMCVTSKGHDRCEKSSPAFICILSTGSETKATPCHSLHFMLHLLGSLPPNPVVD